MVVRGWEPVRSGSFDSAPAGLELNVKRGRLEKKPKAVSPPWGSATPPNSRVFVPSQPLLRCSDMSQSAR